jgi:formiminotetrahydrofolate cyclodeaminase
MTSHRGVADFVTALAAKQPTPGGGGAACVAGAIGMAAARMSAAYTTRKKDVQSGAAAHAQELIAQLDTFAAVALAEADRDEVAYNDLQRSWKDAEMTIGEKAEIEVAALAVPVRMVELCHKSICAIVNFIPVCNPNITSDAKVGVHLLAGAARAAYQTALVNKPPSETVEYLKVMIREAAAAEAGLLELGEPAATL